MLTCTKGWPGGVALGMLLCMRFSYVSTSVSHSDELPCCGTFLLHQGIQRRVALTIVQDSRTDLQWTDVHALTIGCVRAGHKRKRTEGDQGILALNATVVPCARLYDDDTQFVHCITTCFNSVAAGGRAKNYHFMKFSGRIDIFACQKISLLLKKNSPKNKKWG